VIERCAHAFTHTFGDRPTACGISPGRVELLGNHTDYNGGRVLTAAIDRHVVITGRPRSGETARVRSVVMGGTTAFDVHRPARDPDAPWADYVQGVVAGLQLADVEVPAFEAVITSDLPAGSGLGSSAALEAAVVQLIACFSPLNLGSAELALLLQRAENDFVGVHCGILDQFSCLHGRAGEVISLDCATLAHELLSLGGPGPPGPAIVLCDSQTPRSLTSGYYNRRRQECERAAAMLAGLLDRPVERLCDMSLDEFEAVASELPDPLGRRARHVIGENDRVGLGREALRAGRLGEFGRLMADSHRSSRVNFENSTERLDLLQEIASRHPGCLGSRLCGGGWGGHTVSLVAPEAVDGFTAAVRADFRAATGETPAIHVCHAADRARHLLL